MHLHCTSLKEKETPMDIKITKPFSIACMKKQITQCYFPYNMKRFSKIKKKLLNSSASIYKQKKKNERIYKTQ